MPIVLEATMGYFAVRGRPEIVKRSLLAFAAGAPIVVAAEEMLPEAHEEGEPMLGSLAHAFGVAPLASIPVYVEQ